MSLLRTSEAAKFEVSDVQLDGAMAKNLKLKQDWGGTLCDLLLHGFGRSHHRIMQASMEHSDSINLQTRLKDEYTLVATIAALVKTITMSFLVYLKDFRAYFITDSLDSTAFRGTKGWYAYLAYGAMLMTASLMLFISLISAMANLVAFNMLSDRQIPGYYRSTGTFANLPAMGLLWGVVIWHFALMVLMFYMCDVELGIYFSVACTIALVVVFKTIIRVYNAMQGEWEAHHVDQAYSLVDVTLMNNENDAARNLTPRPRLEK